MPGLSYADLTTRPYTKAVGSGNAIVTGPCRVYGMYLNAAAAIATLTVYDALTAINPVCSIQTPANSTAPPHTFGPNGMRFATGLSISTTGAGATLLVLYIVED